MSALIPPFDDDPKLLEKRTTEELVAFLQSIVFVTAKVLKLGAEAWLILDRRGYDMVALRTGLIAYIRLIAGGVVLPETITTFMCNKKILKRVCDLPPAEQKRLCASNSVPVVVHEDGKYTHRMFQLDSLPLPLIKQVFGDRSIRNEAEQIAYLTAYPTPLAVGKIPKRGKVKADRTKGMLRVGHNLVDPADAITALADLRGDAGDDPGAEGKEVTTRLTAAEFSDFAKRAAGAGLTKAGLLRKIINASGVTAPGTT